LSARITNEPVLLSEPATTLSPDALGHRHGFTRDQGLVDGYATVQNLAIDRHLLAGADAQPVSDGDHVERDVLVAAVVTEPPRGLGRQIKQRPDGAGRLFAGAQLKNLAHQNQDGDDGRCLEIDRRAAVHPADRRREQSRRQHRDHAVDPGRADADGDQGEHVEAAVAEGSPAPLEERPAGPQHHGRRQRELDPVGGLARNPHRQSGQMAAHLEREDGQGQDRGNPEAAGEVDQFVIDRRLGGDGLRLQRHAADRAGARALLAHLRMHRAGVDGARDDRRRLPGLAEIAVRIGDEFGPAARRTEEIVLIVVGRPMRCGRRIDGHAADRIDRLRAAVRRFGRTAAVVGRMRRGGHGHGGLLETAGRHIYPKGVSRKALSWGMVERSERGIGCRRKQNPRC
jgi:hypothetical protein